MHSLADQNELAAGCCSCSHATACHPCRCSCLAPVSLLPPPHPSAVCMQVPTGGGLVPGRPLVLPACYCAEGLLLGVTEWTRQCW
jgi:hypothetical protein